MKKGFLVLIVMVIVLGCLTNAKKKFFIKSVKVSERVRIDWYVHSSTSNLAPDFVQISTQKEPFFVSYYLTNINFRNDSLFLSLWKNEYEKFDTLALEGIKFLIDTVNGQWNDAPSRFDRLRKAEVNIDSPHFVDVYCPNGACDDYNKNIRP